MRHYPLLYPGATAVLPPQLFGAVEYYRLMSRFDSVFVDASMRFDKRMKSVQRFSIVDAPGVQTLTAPVSKPAGPVCWCGSSWSAQGEWWLAVHYGLAAT